MVMYYHTVQIYLISLGKKLLQSLTSKHIDLEHLVSLLKADSILEFGLLKDVG